MDPDEVFSPKAGDPLTLVARQDLDPLSVEELAARIDRLKAEILRCETRMAAAEKFRASADAIFRR